MELISDLAKQYVTSRLESELSNSMLYHNIDHTIRVVKKVNYLADAEQINDDDKELLLIAAWFHDLGYINQHENHEKISTDYAREFLKTLEISHNEIEQIADLIMSTKNGVKPINILQKILKDADCSHLASEEYLKISNLLRKEWNSRGDKLNKKDWLTSNIDFMENHSFYTDTASTKWIAQKNKNMEIVKENLQVLKHNNKKKSNDKRSRGVETLFRVQLRNHISLSAIADHKANILLSVNAIIISVSLSSLLPKLDNLSNSFLVYPTMILTIFSVICIVLSVLSTRPNISNVDVTREMIMDKKTNILFFGNFHKMGIKEFEWGIEYLLDNEENLYNSLTQDLYYLGLVLERKYRLLRITYNVFMVGIVISAISFIASFFLTAQVT